MGAGIWEANRKLSDSEAAFCGSKGSESGGSNSGEPGIGEMEGGISEGLAAGAESSAAKKPARGAP